MTDQILIPRFFNIRRFVGVECVNKAMLKTIIRMWVREHLDTWDIAFQLSLAESTVYNLLAANRAGRK